MNTEDLQKRIDDLTKRYNNVARKKAELKGQLDARKAELVALTEEIKAAGYDPKKLKEERDRHEAELIALVSSAEKELTEVEAALAKYSSK
jgi:predicted nuclease with TOPRIM domain